MYTNVDMIRRIFQKKIFGYINSRTEFEMRKKIMLSQILIDSQKNFETIIFLL
jgi:hypothetical protein